MIKSLSPTSLIDLCHCSKLFYFKHIEKIPAPTSGRQFLGRVFHQTVSFGYSYKLNLGQEINLSDLVDNFKAYWEKGLSETQILWQESSDELFQAGLKLLTIYRNEIMPGYEPVAIDQKVEGKIDGILYLGYIDLQVKKDNEICIVDHKIRKRRLTQKEAEKDIQATSYGLLKGEPISFEFHIGLLQKNPEFEIITTKRTWRDYNWLRDMVVLAYNLVNKAQDFLPNPTFWGCQEFDNSGRGCYYWSYCHLPEGF